MMHHPTLCAVAISLLSALPGVQAGLYTKKSPVLQVDAKNYDKLISNSKYTSVVEFYAPWCGHCQNLKPAYEKAAKNLEGLANVAAVNCDEDANKPLCGSMGVQGFPTLKIVRPKKGGGKPAVQDYQGPRTATAIVDAVVQQINNYVVKIEDKTLDKFLSDKNETAKAILFTEKGTTSALLKSLAIDFDGVITIGQARNKEAKTVGTFNVDKFPTLVLLPGGDAPGKVYEGEIKKTAMVEFLSQAGKPTTGAQNDKKASKEKPKKESEKKSKKPKAESKTESSEKSSATTEAQTEAPTQEAPVIVETALPIPAINSHEKLIRECLTEKSHTCVLAFIASSEEEKAKQALESLANLAFKHAQSKRKLFPFFEVPTKDNEGVASLLKTLGLSGDVELVALNARRGWWRRYEGDDFSRAGVEAWIDAIRMSEGVKKKLPEGIVAIAVESTGASQAEPEATSSATPSETESASSEEATPVTPEASSEAVADSAESTDTKATDPTPETETSHDEL